VLGGSPHGVSWRDSRNGQTFSVPRQSRGFTHHNYKNAGDTGDWAPIRIENPGRGRNFPSDFPKPMETGLAPNGETYDQLELVAAGYPGYTGPGAKRLFADWKCTSQPAYGNMAATSCEGSGGFSGGGLFGFDDHKKPFLVGLTSTGSFGAGETKDFIVGTDIVTFELDNGHGGYEIELSDGRQIQDAMNHINCDEVDRRTVLK
jgi:hypothetical protein